MVSRDSIEQHRAAAADLSELVATELAAYFAALDLSRPEPVRNALLDFMPLLISEYGQVAQSLAIEWYEQLRFESGATARFLVTAPPAPSVTPERVEAKVRYLAAQLWTPEPEKMLAGLSTASDKYVKQFGRDTISWNAGQEGAGYARVPTGAITCAFCLVQASRSAVYYSRESAGDVDGTGFGDDYHGHCDCEVVRIGPGEDYPPGYLPDDYYDMYRVGHDATRTDPEVIAFMDSLDPHDPNRLIKGVAFAMRREFPDQLKDGVHAH
ncbi:hypothetical protein [Pseudarthrobacter sp. NIBRBAC000502770]|uniref:VG15 protein n=1 Tax=Pseudarthrobacter sp. NIBRBAC000502770 TaxID=2590785 RepID=UPI001140474D|nr:hypothetical protein [Pseudarthrobacter sp. NIBRBAC000502770]QDG90712.1 hypothetical protein NIBR502770_21040 [Pseudarthrobacter sp. NIBRBAC000502770]